MNVGTRGNRMRARTPTPFKGLIRSAELGHTEARTTARYARLAADQVKLATGDLSE